MNDMTAQLAAQLRSNPAALRSLMQSPDGQALLQLLTQGDQGAGLRQAAQAAAQGNPAQLMAMMNQLMSTKEGAQLVERLRRQAEESGLS